MHDTRTKEKNVRGQALGVLGGTRRKESVSLEVNSASRKNVRVVLDEGLEKFRRRLDLSFNNLEILLSALNIHLLFVHL
jgi:hypothetical protein